MHAVNMTFNFIDKQAPNVINTTIFGMELAEQPVTTLFSGCIGFRQSTISGDSKTLLNTMQAAGFLEHQVVSFYVNFNGTQGVNSYVKFGGMDKEAYSGSLNIIGTVDQYRWNLNATDITWFG